ncbi:PRMT4 [Auxenochlorella protothecoides x Auxenochlorella symbiontica]
MGPGGLEYSIPDPSPEVVALVRALGAPAPGQDAPLPRASRAGSPKTGSPGTPTPCPTPPSTFDARTDAGSAELYFHYYGQLQHQQNMLADALRTGTYHAAISENSADFAGKAVLDVGAGSGVLSLFAARAGARVVYAVEASPAAQYARRLVQAQPGLAGIVHVIQGRVEDVELPEKVDVLISEPMGTLLVNERMIESYLAARDKHMKPGGKMFPSLGRIHVAGFSDPYLHAEVMARSAFWKATDFFGLDLSCLEAEATAGYFGQVVVDAIPSGALVSNTAQRTIDFATAAPEDLRELAIPLSLQVAAPGPVHGLACWFDVLFEGSQAPRWLSTAPGLPTTHWFQLRCLLQEPVQVAKAGDTLTGRLHLLAHSRQSYDVTLELSSGASPVSVGRYDLKEPYYRQLNQWIPVANGAEATYEQMAAEAGQGPST